DYEEPPVPTIAARQTGGWYSVPAPGGSWDPTDNGRYRVLIRRRAVLDTKGKAVPVGQIGAFRVNLQAAQTEQSFSAPADQPLVITQRPKRDTPVFLA
ncbi:MAG TPA: hypothetical protein VH475_00420, partial [Tepidisphaeraceae bacterium]